MLVYQHSVRVRYAETDQMGYVYYGNYASYFEEARVAMLRSFGVSYKHMEKQGVMLPVLEFHIKYIKPAYYDEVLIIKVFIKEFPNTRIKFEYETYNAQNELLNIGFTTLVFVNIQTKKPTLIAPELAKTLQNNWQTMV